MPISKIGFLCQLTRLNSTQFSNVEFLRQFIKIDFWAIILDPIVYKQFSKLNLYVASFKPIFEFGIFKIAVSKIISFHPVSNTKMFNPIIKMGTFKYYQWIKVSCCGKNELEIKQV